MMRRNEIWATLEYARMLEIWIAQMPLAFN
jgi:hypothetical protein